MTKPNLFRWEGIVVDHRWGPVVRSSCSTTRPHVGDHNWGWVSACVRLHRFEMRREFALQIGDTSLFLHGHIGGLAKVFGEVVLFHVAASVDVFDQLPFTLADAAGRAIMVIVGIMPVKRLSRIEPRLGINQQRLQAQSVDRLILREVFLRQCRQR